MVARPRSSGLPIARQARIAAKCYSARAPSRKKDIRGLDTDLGLDFIEKLKPVSYRFNNCVGFSLP
jgi:Chaperone of endosialidase